MLTCNTSCPERRSASMEQSRSPAPRHWKKCTVTSWRRSRMMALHSRLCRNCRQVLWVIEIFQQMTISKNSLSVSKEWRAYSRWLETSYEMYPCHSQRYLTITHMLYASFLQQWLWLNTMQQNWKLMPSHWSHSLLVTARKSNKK